MSFTDPWSDDPYGNDEPDDPSFEEIWGHPDVTVEDPPYWEGANNTRWSTPEQASASQPNDDPWAAEFADSDSSTDNEENDVTDATRTGQFEAHTTVNDKGEVVVTLKQHGGFDSPWLVFHGATPGEVQAQIVAALNGGLGDTVAKAAELFAATRKAPTGAAPAPAQPRQAAPARPAARPSSGGDGRSCHHGTMVFREGINKFDKPYKAYFCPSPKGTPDQCPATFLS